MSSAIPRKAGGHAIAKVSCERRSHDKNASVKNVATVVSMVGHALLNNEPLAPCKNWEPNKPAWSKLFKTKFGYPHCLGSSPFQSPANMLEQ